jgi:HlyD family secretion protein
MNLSRRTYVLIAGGLVVLLVVLVAALMPRGQDTAASALEVGQVRRGTLAATVNATGAVSPVREAQMAFTTGGALTQLNVAQGDQVKAGQVLATLDTRALEFQLAQSEATLTAAQAKLDQLKNPSPADVAAAQASVASADAALAQLKLPTPSDLLMAKADLDKAKAAVDRAQADYDRIGGASNPFIAMTQQSQALQQATSDYQKAQAVYNAKINPSDSQIKQAQSTLEQARAQLVKLQNPSPNDLKNAQANVDQARAGRDLAKANLDNAILRAPFDGIVTHVDFDLGSFAMAGKTVLGVADASELRVKLNIDETDIAGIKTGQNATVDLDAYPGVTLDARVSDVAAAATTNQGVVNYVVTVTLDPGSTPVKFGMTANANIITARKDNVLLVPNRAIRAEGSKRFVTVQKPNGASEEVEIKTGMANDQETEVMSGLNEGQPVLISNTQAPNPALSPFGTRK